MTNEQASTARRIADMTTREKLDAMAADPGGYYGRAYEEEQPRAGEQVDRQLRQLGRESLMAGES